MQVEGGGGGKILQCACSCLALGRHLGVLAVEVFAKLCQGLVGSCLECTHLRGFFRSEVGPRNLHF